MTAQERPEGVPEETTPLLGESSNNGEDLARIQVSRWRGSAIVAAMGLLLFIMSMGAPL